VRDTTLENTARQLCNTDQSPINDGHNLPLYASGGSTNAGILFEIISGRGRRHEVTLAALHRGGRLTRVLR
jgi:hypothetical protein